VSVPRVRRVQRRRDRPRGAGARPPGWPSARAGARRPSLRVGIRVDRSRRAGDSGFTPGRVSAAHRGRPVSGYFDALMRARGMAIGGPAPTAMLRQSDAFEAVADPGASGMETTGDVPAMPPASRRPAEPVLAAAKPFVVNDPIVHRANAIATRD